MTRRILASAALLLMLAALYPVYAKAPAELFGPAKVEILAAEVEAQSAKLGELLATKEGYEALQADGMKARLVPQAGGIISIVAQTIAEHPEKEKTKINATALRDAGLAVQQAKSYEEAHAAHAQVKAALAGTGEAGAVEHDWTKLSDMYNMMEEVNARSALLGRAVRRPRDVDEAVRDATTLAVLAAVIEIDTHPVTDPAKVPQWKKYATTYRESMSKVAEALRTNDPAAARTAYAAGIRACDFCHEDFRAK
ncbi:MAG: hypothetical protein WED34_04890 [Planctomycetales bacterium]